MAPTQSQQYISTRGGSSGLSFEDVVLKGLADDGGLFVPQAIPSLPADWRSWKDLSFEQLAVKIMSLYISEEEIDNASLQEIARKTYSTFRHPDVTPLVPLDKAKNIYLLELFHGPTFAFKDVALQFLGNLFEFFLVRRNSKLQEGEKRHHLTIVGATSGDTGSAAIYGLRNKRDVSVFILFPTGRVSPIQEAQMTTVLDKNVHCLSLNGTFDDCQDMVKALFADPEIRKTQHLGAVNSINWARILAQITYYFYGYFSLLKQEGLSFEEAEQKISFTVPTGNFGDILAGFFAKRMGLPISKLIISTNENDILYRFFQSGKYEKRAAPAKSSTSHGGLKEDGAEAHEGGVKETLSPAMDILVSSNFERLVWMLHYEAAAGASISSASQPSAEKIEAARKEASERNAQLFQSLKSSGSFAVAESFLSAAKEDFAAERISDIDTVNRIKSVYSATASAGKGYILDPHSAIGVDAAYRSVAAQQDKASFYISLSTAHPAKFANAVDLALKGTDGYAFKDVFPPEFEGLETAEKKVINVEKSKGLEGVRQVILDEVKAEGVAL